jgi:DNA-directed RNA polymerase subunit beta
VVESVDATRIVVRAAGEGAEVPDIYHLMKYQRSNQSTCYTQKPIVRTGDVVKPGDVLADGPVDCDMGELALGQNVLVAFMPWQGYNFEDSILVSERIAKDDVFTSIHIEEFECVARDTKLGKEEITRDIPNVGEEALKDLDDSGIVRIGAEVKSGRHPRRQDHPEGRDAALPRGEAPPRDLRREGRRRARQLAQGPAGRQRHRHQRPRLLPQGHREGRARPRHRGPGARRIERTRDEEIKILRDSFYRRVKELLIGKTTTGKLVDDKGKVLLAEGRRHRRGALLEIPRKYWGEIPSTSTEQVQQILRDLEDLVRSREEHFRDKIERLSKGDELPPGVIKMVKVYIAIKRKLQVGDKMAGRHGNKGVISRILPEEDMPYLAGRTPVDIVLNPLGVPSRMNVGQILEIHLGWGAYELGRQLSDGRREAARHELATKIKAIYKGDEQRRGDRSSRATTRSSASRRRSAAASSWRRRSSTAPPRRTSRARSRSRTSPRAARRSSSTGARARRSTRTSRWASCTC